MTHISNDTINKYIESELTENEYILLEKHLDECDSCSQELEFSKLLFKNVKESAIITPSPDFSDKLMREITKIAQPKFNFKKYFNAQNCYAVFFALALGLYVTLTIIFDGSKKVETSNSFYIFYKKITDYLYQSFGSIQQKVNILFQKNGFYYFFLGIVFIILFLLFDKYIVEKKPKQKSIGTFLL